MKPKLDRNGYLTDPADWSPAAAEWLAAQSGLTLTNEHWQAIDLIRAFYTSHEVVPSMRVLVKLMREHLGEARGTSLYLMKLFPETPLKSLARIAGLPRPTNCL